MKRRNSQSGVAAMELAIVLPFLLLMFWGITELSRLFLIHLKLDKVAVAMADFATQGNELTRADLQRFSTAADQIMWPFDFDGTLVFTGVVNQPTPSAPCQGFPNLPCNWWQYYGQGQVGSKLGTPGRAPTFPVVYQLGAGQQVIAAEVFYQFRPLLNFNGVQTFTGAVAPVLTSQQLYKIALFKPRNVSVLPLN